MYNTFIYICKYSKLQARLQEVWERYGTDDISASQLLKECSKFILRFEFSKVQDFENFELSSMLLEGIVFQTALTLIGLLRAVPLSSPTGSTHSSYNMNQLMKKVTFLLHSRYDAYISEFSLETNYLFKKEKRSLNC